MKYSRKMKIAGPIMVPPRKWDEHRRRAVGPPVLSGCGGIHREVAA
jgi:hypothetical protein